MSFERTRRLLQRLLAPRAPSAEPAPRVEDTVDGASAAALVEALICEGAGLGGPASEDPSTRALLTARAHASIESGGLDAAHLEPGDGPRGALATALGMATSGLRATAFVDGEALPGLHDLVETAAARRIPLVLHVGCGASGGPTRGLGDGHRALHAIADTGAVLLFAKNVQEVFDLSLIARRVAEDALLPVVVAMDANATGAVEAQVDLLRAEDVRAFVGAPDDFVDAPDEVQAMLFGPRRRRVLRWHDLERPLLHGATQPDWAFTLTAASQQGYGPEAGAALERAFEAFTNLTGRAYAALDGPVRRRADLLVIAQGSLLERIEAIAGTISRDTKHAVSTVGLRVLHPWPGAGLARALEIAPAALVLERGGSAGAEGPLTRGLRDAIDRALENRARREDVNPGYPSWTLDQRPRVFSALALGPTEADLEAYLREVLAGRGRRHVTLGACAAPALAAWPKRQGLVDSVESLGAPPPVFRAAEGAPPSPRPRSTPPVLGAVTRADPTVFGLARFWDQVGGLAAAGAQAALTPDPFFGTGTMPPWTASFRDVTPVREQLPVIDAGACTGCGVCWSTCPEGAIGAAAWTIDKLLAAGVARARADGHTVDGLRPLLGKAGKAAVRVASAGEVMNAEPWLREAFESVLGKAKADDDKKAELRRAFSFVVERLAEVDLSVTERLYAGPERAVRGQGALLSLSVDPDACKGCGLCSAVCGDGAISVAPDSAAATCEARAGRAAWAAMPDTSGAIVDAARDVIGPLAANLLSRHSLGLVPGDAVEAGSGQRQVLRLALAAAEAHGQRAQATVLRRLERLADALAAQVHELLGAGLPDADLDALASGLRSLGREDVDLATLTANMQQAVAGGRVDAGRLQEVTDLARRLRRHAFALREGSEGLGRSRVSLVLAQGSFADALARFPYNPFTGPVTIAPAGATARLARGVLEGQLAAWMPTVADVLQAEAFTATPPRYDEPVDASLDRLTPEDRALVPPLFVVGDEAALAEAELGALQTLLTSNRPFKVILLAEPGRRLGLAGGETSASPALLAALGGRAFVAQTTIAYPEHFGRALASWSSFDGPGLLYAYAASPSRDEVATDASVALAKLAVDSRVFPLFTFDPRRPGVFGARFELSGNPDCEAEWSRGSDGVVMPQAWLTAQGRFADPAALPPDRAEAAIERWARQWRTLQELAGVVTAFTERVQAETTAQLEAAHARALEALRAELEGRYESERQARDAETTAQLTARLMAWAGYSARTQGSER